MNPPMPRTRWLPARSVSLVATALLCLLASSSSAEEAPKVVVPPTQNPYFPVIASLYDQAKYEEALSKVEKALDGKSLGPQEELWLKLMKGVLQAELAQGAAMESFKEALALDPNAQLPVNASRRLQKLFEQARNTAGLPTDAELLAEELGPVLGPPPRRQGLSVSVRGEVDALGLSVTKAIAPAVGLGYTREKLGGELTLLVQPPAPGLRVEGQYHPLTLGWVRPYAGLGATLFFHEEDVQGGRPFFGGVGGRVTLGADVQWNSRMYGFAGVAYEYFLASDDRYRSQSALFSLGVGVFP